MELCQTLCEPCFDCVKIYKQAILVLLLRVRGLSIKTWMNYCKQGKMKFLCSWGLKTRLLRISANLKTIVWLMSGTLCRLSEVFWHFWSWGHGSCRFKPANISSSTWHTRKDDKFIPASLWCWWYAWITFQSAMSSCWMFPLKLSQRWHLQYTVSLSACRGCEPLLLSRKFCVLEKFEEQVRIKVRAPFFLVATSSSSYWRDNS